MRIRAFLVVAMACSVATGAAIQACGGSSVADPPADSGPPETGPADTGPKDTGAKDVATDTAPPCDPKADILSSIPDASIADGATTTGICLGCVNTKCSKEVNDCKADCPCQKVAKDALQCYLKNIANPLVCAGNFTTVPQKTQQIGLSLFSCIRNECDNECAASAFDPDAGDGGDGG